MRTSLVHILVLYLSSICASGQDSLKYEGNANETRKGLIGGFIRGGFYSWTDNSDNKPYFSSAFSDLGLRLEISKGLNFTAYADLRFRYGSEFLKPVNKFDIREAFVRIKGRKWDLSIGQQIIKWGRCDFTNPMSRFNPQNNLSRSPDREDMDLGNLLGALGFYPSANISVEAVLAPYYRPSVLIIDPVPLPEYIVINDIGSLLTGKEMLSYGFKLDFFTDHFDAAISWFDGYDPMPGLALSEFNLDLTQTVPSVRIILDVIPYRNRVLGFDMETIAGPFGIRGQVAWSEPDHVAGNSEYVPFSEIKWIAGFDWGSGSWRIISEYSGKYLPDFTSLPVEPLIGNDTDLQGVASQSAMPDFDPGNYVRQKVAAFNRLYNYQTERFSHSAGLRTEAEFAFGKVLPSVFTMYNFSSGDLLIIPEIKFRPTDGLSLTAGAEIYSGRRNSLYELVNDFMNGFYASVRVDF